MVIKRTTYTKRVLDYLIELDDFATHKQVQAALRITLNQTTATLHDLRRARAVDVMEVDGVLWFYATPESDTRTQIHAEIKEGITRNRKPRRPIKWVLWIKMNQAYVSSTGFAQDVRHALEFDTVVQAKAHASLMSISDKVTVMTNQEKVKP